MAILKAIKIHDVRNFALIGRRKVIRIPRRLEFPFLMMRCRKHWSLWRDLEIVMVNGLTPGGNLQLMPLGPLREPLTARQPLKRPIERHKNERHASLVFVLLGAYMVVCISALTPVISVLAPIKGLEIQAKVTKNEIKVTEPIKSSSWNRLRIGDARYYEPSKGLLQSGCCAAQKFLLKWITSLEKQKMPNGPIESMACALTMA
ncbi:hypothetical protein K1719_008437 [Acacia pycnantha]|nr:hypothetical protein K1719_008437 [Acacia pycnantha]